MVNRSKRNQDIRDAAKTANVPYWEIGERMGVRQNTIMRWLNDPLSNEEKQEFFSVIEEIARTDGEGKV